MLHALLTKRVKRDGLEPLTTFLPNGLRSRTMQTPWKPWGGILGVRVSLGNTMPFINKPDERTVFCVTDAFHAWHGVPLRQGHADRCRH